MSRNYDRNTNYDDQNDRSGKKADYEKLSEKRKEVISRKAKKFKSLIFSKYTNLALPSLLEKARKYKKKYDFTENEFNAFVNMALSDKSYSPNLYNQPNTPIAKALGYNQNATSGKMVVPTNELDVINSIMRLKGENNILHEQVVIQSLMYQDCAPQALTGQYRTDKHNSFSYIHPVIAALFLPRIKYLDEHMLLASLSNIVHARFNDAPIRTQPEYELYWDLITDPNEIACVTPKESPLKDLHKRVQLQVELWKCVRELREGRYYSDHYRNFINALDACSTGYFDSPDMTYVRDEGMVLRKLFGAFSLRPTIVSISTLSSGVVGHYGYNINPLAATQVTSIPLVNLRLPINQTKKNYTVKLAEALEQPDWFVQNKMLVPKVKNIIYSRDIIVFYANRRYQSIVYSRLHMPYNFSMLPATHSSLETINDVNISWDPVITVGDDKFLLRSVVFVEKSFTNKDLIVGCTTGIIIPANPGSGRLTATYLLYDPQSAGIQFINQNGVVDRNEPIVEIPGNNPLYNTGIDSFQLRASKRGTIYVYVKNVPQNTNLKPF